MGNPAMREGVLRHDGNQWTYRLLNDQREQVVALINPELVAIMDHALNFVSPRQFARAITTAIERIPDTSPAQVQALEVLSLMRLQH